MARRLPIRVLAMIVERSMHPDWLSNTYLVAAGPGSDGFLVDAGGPVRPLLDTAEREGITITWRSWPPSATASRTRRC
jgi:hypothetical protein